MSEYMISQKIKYISGQFKNMTNYPTSQDVEYLVSLSKSSIIDVNKFAKRHSIANVPKLISIFNKNGIKYSYEDNNT